MAKRAMTLGTPDPTIEEITDYDRRHFGTAVRFEIDVCGNIQDLKKDINTIRAELTNCLVTLEQNAPGNVRRHMVHSRLASLRAELKFRRKERNDQGFRQIVQSE